MALRRTSSISSSGSRSGSGWRALVGLTAFFVALAPAASGCGSDNSVVDGSCADGYLACDGRCVLGASCNAGSGDGSDDGRARSDGESDGAPGDRDGSLRDGATPGDRDGATPGDRDGATPGDGCPPPPYVTAAACGSCFIQCASPNDTCRLDGAGSYTCQPPCTAPEVLCAGRCIDVRSDPLNCGACGKICASNLCVAGLCQGAAPGDVVLVGADYRQVNGGSAQARVLTNAVLIPSSNPLRVLSYERYAEFTSVMNVKSLVTAAAGARTVSYSVSNDAAALASADLAKDFDVVLVYDQRNGDAPTLQAEGATWKAPLGTFAKAGGVVVVLDGNAGNGNMPALLRSSGLFDVTAHASLTPGSRVAILAPNDVVGTLVPSPFGVFQRAASFTLTEPNGGDVTYVAAVDLNPGIGSPVVVHRIAR
jgi:hypothetical protein